MYHKIILAAVLLLLVAEPALAAEPCQRGTTQMKMAGIDMDEMRCQLQTAVETAAREMSKNIAADAQMRMLSNDLASAKAETDKLRAENEKFKSAQPKPAPAK